jgi:phosphatidate cytidylyltransferase
VVRLASGLLLAAAALAAILFLPVVALRVLACAVAAVAAHEYLRLAGSNGAVIGAVVAACWLASLDREPYLAGIVWVMLLLVVVQVLAAAEPLGRAAAGAFGCLYIGVPLGLLVAVQARGGWQATVLLLAAIIVSDTCQYYAGRTFGRRPLAPTISPKKTMEGALGGLLAAVTFVIIAGAWVFPGAGLGGLALLGVTIVVLGIAGDLFESRLKREAGLKDSSNLIPGHGGILDRIDALLFVAPAYYVYLRLLDPVRTL